MIYYTLKTGQRSTFRPMPNEPILWLRDSSIGFDPTLYARVLGLVAYNYSNNSTEWRQAWPLARCIAQHVGIRCPLDLPQRDRQAKLEDLAPYVRFLVEQGLVPFKHLTEFDKDLIFIKLPPSNAPKPIKNPLHELHCTWQAVKQWMAAAKVACPAQVVTGHLGTQHGVSARLEPNLEAPGEFRLFLTIKGTAYWPIRVTFEKDTGYLRVLKTELRYKQKVGRRMVHTQSDIEQIAYKYINPTTGNYLRLHRLLMALWLQLDLNGQHIDHRNANRADTRLSNLDPLTRKAHRAKHWATWVQEGDVGGPEQHRPSPARTQRVVGLMKHRGLTLVRTWGDGQRLEQGIVLGPPASYQRRFGLPKLKAHRRVR